MTWIARTLEAAETNEHVYQQYPTECHVVRRASVRLFPDLTMSTGTANSIDNVTPHLTYSCPYTPGDDRCISHLGDTGSVGFGSRCTPEAAAGLFCPAGFVRNRSGVCDTKNNEQHTQKKSKNEIMQKHEKH